eukprot:CAMPEP_0183524156 /NCGR_PEP_ID=MMETSP0371-20130417/19688_1 /TAXON_ID=268820 /ORGANISM="Peridinium aciculiferum, Strain PAER-2" /LENGTH=210 /DNA_ID=CAMNT_0025723213 /DNA_START=133 /DNA_END=766 /DNA_ORIENTATION=-
MLNKDPNLRGAKCHSTPSPSSMVAEVVIVVLVAQLPRKQVARSSASTAMHHEKEAEPDGSSTHHRKDEADVAPAVVHGRVHFGLLHGFQAAGRARATLTKTVRLQLESLQAHLATQALVADGAATLQAARAAARGGVAEVPLVASLGADLGLWVKEARVFRTIWSAHEEPVLARLLPVRRLDHEVNQPLVPHIHWNDDCCRRPLHLSDKW